jgi:hypothetical protein
MKLTILLIFFINSINCQEKINELYGLKLGEERSYVKLLLGVPEKQQMGEFNSEYDIYYINKGAAILILNYLEGSSKLYSIQISGLDLTESVA